MQISIESATIKAYLLFSLIEVYRFITRYSSGMYMIAISIL